MYVLCLVDPRRVDPRWRSGCARPARGGALIATRDNEPAAAAAGIDPDPHELERVPARGEYRREWPAALHVQLLHRLSAQAATRSVHSIKGLLHRGHRRASSVGGAVSGVLLFQLPRDGAGPGRPAPSSSPARACCSCCTRPPGRPPPGASGRYGTACSRVVARRHGIDLEAPSADGSTSILLADEVRR